MKNYCKCDTVEETHTVKTRRPITQTIGYGVRREASGAPAYFSPTGLD